ncbi:diguanylate cyclase [Phormidium sp. LEGE 05292]|uniref:GGDEF domain-containing protein n=1 Tax=[Phormidium] sp. LEGE 05292 TaxID=767427 RepID=UPI0018814E7B|nr:GGDEF domain-containing protein [Phormidium sp. LEGE 05292]MBE9225080.1 diguanylate cyclase [Phormidium sp. LEGE 05292]
MYIYRYLENRSKSFLIGLGILLVIVIGFIDYLISPDIASIFFLLPVALGSWFVSEKFGILISLTCAIAWFIIYQLKGEILLPNYLPYWNAFIRLSFYLTVNYLLAELHNARKRESKLARTDEITGVANRKLFVEFASMELKKSRRYGHPFTVTYIDLDNFKNINDYGGYKVGDRVLQVVAQTIKNTVRETDIVARIGGDEFIIFLPGLAYEPAQIVMNRVRNMLLETMDKNVWPITFSIGAITYINCPETVEEIIEKADYLMYCIKNKGKNIIEHITEI